MSEKQKDKHLIKETALNKDKKYTYGDYLGWDDDQRYELIDGEVYLMSPGPSWRHQEILSHIFYQFYHYLRDKKCKVFCAPLDIRLPEGEERDEDIKTVVQPDILVVCDEEKLDKPGCKGAPDLVVEIISPSSGKRDRKIKRDLYERHGVKEYWLVDNQEEVVEVYILNQDYEYGKSEVYTDQDKIAINIFDDLEIDVETIFKE